MTFGTFHCGATSWDWQIGRLYGSIAYPRFWRPAPGSRWRRPWYNPCGWCVFTFGWDTSDDNDEN